MTRSILLILGACLAIGFYSGMAHGAVTYKNHPVRAVLVGAIDATPCSDPKGCVRGIVELRYRRRHHDHLVRCVHPKHLHVVGTFPFAGRRWANVYACSKNYYWRLP